MSKETYEEQILKAIDIVVEEKIKQLAFDKTLPGIVQSAVLDSENKKTGEYRIKYQDSIFTAYVNLDDEIYEIGDVVSVKIPLGDFTNRNIIMGYTSKVKTSLSLSTALSALGLAEDAQEAADGQILGFFQGTEPSEGMSFGDIWVDTDDEQIYRYEDINGLSTGALLWRLAPNSAIGKAFLTAYLADIAAGEAQTTADGKIKTFYQDAAPGSGISSLGDLWVDTNDNNKLYRFNGTIWQSVRDGTIEEAKTLAESKTAVYKADAGNGNFNLLSQPGFAILIGGPYYTGAGMSPGDMWIVTDFPYETGPGWKTYTWTGTAWSTPDTKTTVDGGIITANSLHARSIVSDSITAEKINVGDRSVTLTGSFYPNRTAANETIVLGKLYFGGGTLVINGVSGSLTCAPQLIVNITTADTYWIYAIIPGTTNSNIFTPSGTFSLAYYRESVEEEVLPEDTDTNKYVNIGSWKVSTTGQAGVLAINTGQAKINPGDIQAGIVNATVEMTSPIFRYGKNGYTDTTNAGFWLGKDSTTAKFFFGNANSSKYIKWTGSDLLVQGGGITGGTITGATITGGIVRTATTGNRIQLTEDNLEIISSGGKELIISATDTGAFQFYSNVPGGSQMFLSPNATQTSGAFQLQIYAKPEATNVEEKRREIKLNSDTRDGWGHPTLSLGIPGSTTRGAILKALVSEASSFNCRDMSDTYYVPLAANTLSSIASKEKDTSTEGARIYLFRDGSLGGTPTDAAGFGGVILKVWNANTLEVRNRYDDGWGILKAGNIVADSTVTANGIVLTSDKDLKKNITIFEKPIESDTALAAVKKIVPKFFEYKDEEEDNSYLGFIAQDLPAELVHIGDQEKNMLGYSLNEMVAFLWKAVQELAEQVDILEQKEVLI